MPLQSFGDCPWCGERIDLRKQAGVYACPVCSCTFTRNAAKWKVGIPVAILVAALLWMLVPCHGRLLAGLGAIGVLIITAKSSHHRIISRGRADLTAGEAKKHKAKWKESKWFIVAVVLLLMAVIALLVLGLIRKP
jgi:hypothetical protein